MRAMKMFDRRMLLKTGLGIGLGGTLFGTSVADNKAPRHAPEGRVPGPVEADSLSVGQPAPSLGTNLFYQKWARADLAKLGIPRSWWHVHQGVFPFSPERVLVIGRRPWAWSFGGVKQRLLARGLPIPK
jgi:hypothetical protein